MKKINLFLYSTNTILFFFYYSASSQNPIIRDQFTADPSARVFNSRVYVFPSHDIANQGKGRKNWFCMEDYHVFSSDNLTDWIDHGVIISQNKVEWVDSTSYSMWAPDCIERNGKYYFYFPSTQKVSGTNDRRGFTIGVAIADKPEGPYIPQTEPIKNLRGIDPNVFIDKDGQAYLYWSMRNIYVAKLKENMIELESEPQVIANLPEKGLKEGPYLFERNDFYYLTFPHVENNSERLEYAIGDNPMGPFKMTGVIMDESPMNCWTNHHSFIEFKGQWYLFYHQNAYSPKFDKNRSICMDSMFFNTDGTIKKVIPTFRGVGLTKASIQIQIDRYSTICDKGASIAFLDTLNVYKGWKTILDSKNAWIKYNAVDFGKKKTKHVEIKTLSGSGSIIQICLDSPEGEVLSEVKIPKNNEWGITKTKIKKNQSGIKNLVVVLKDDSTVEIDWITFK